MITVAKICNKCGHELLGYPGFEAIAIVCPDCRKVSEFREGKIISSSTKAPANTKPNLLVIGSKGIIKSIEYTITGCAYKKENGTSYFWHEYTLFNSSVGVAFLTVYDGHWTYLKEIATAPTVKMGNLHLDEDTYMLYSKYAIRIKEADGVFPYRFSTIDDIRVREFISPPLMLCSEKRGEDLIWFKGEYITPDEIKEGFKVNNIPKLSGIGAVQPSNSKIKRGPFIWCIFIIALIALFIQVYFSETAKNQVIYSAAFEIGDSLSSKDIYTPSFDLKDGTKNVEITLNSDVSNSWAYAAFTLVNEKTGDIYDLDMEVEYYHGFEGGESWTEGSGTSYKFISSVPEGKYYLIIHPEKELLSKSVTYFITVSRDVFMGSNGLVLLFVISIYPIFYFIRNYWFERRRWSKSDFSPYDNE